MPRWIWILFVCLTLACGAFAQIDSPNFRYVAINVPGAASTSATGINNHGMIVGFYQVGTNCQSGVPLPGCDRFHGFTIVNGKMRTLDVGSRFTEILGVNDFGDVVGVFEDNSSRFHGFLRHHTGAIQRIDPPGATLCSEFTGCLGGPPSAVNTSLTVVGGNWKWHNGVFTKLDFTTPGGGETQNWSGISNSGVIVGSLFHQDFWNGIQLAGRDFDLFPRINGSDTHVFGVNGRDDLVGTGSLPGSGFFSPHVERGEGTGDKPEKPLNPLSISFPGSPQTIPNAINYNQMIVGSYVDPNHTNVTHGFLAVH